MSEKIAALICIWFVVFINCYSVKLTQKFLKFFGYGKIVSLAVIIGGGIYFNLTGKAEQSRDSQTVRSADRNGRNFPSKFSNLIVQLLYLSLENIRCISVRILYISL